MDFYIKDAKNYIGQTVTVRGWVFNKRSSGSIVFLQIRDGSGFIQAVVSKKDVSPEAFEAADNLTDESSVIIKGGVKEEPRSPYGYEINVSDLKIIHLSQNFPIAKKVHGVDFLLSLRHLWLRSRKQWAILRVRNQIINAINEFLQNDDYIKIDAPIITPSACEGTTTLFSLKYFDKTAYLSQSGQLYLEAAIFSFGKCYDFGPTFRAEKSKTKRHLTEFWMMDAEAAFLEYEGLLELEEKLIYFVIQKILENCKQEFQILDRDPAPLQKIKPPFLRLTYQETLAKLKELGSDIKEGEDLGNDDETILMNHFDQPLFIMKFPASFKAFYFKRDENNPEATLSADLLAPEGYGEITGGGQREDDYQTLLARIKEMGINENDYNWYLDLRKYGSVPHAGFGVGLERLVAWICHLDHIRKTIPFPRTIYRFSP
ncbi:MAG: asparagine--tRNA ligase [bacterium]|nr:asparagine--tRNA ligase [bacterium]